MQAMQWQRVVTGCIRCSTARYPDTILEVSSLGPMSRMNLRRYTAPVSPAAGGIDPAVEARTETEPRSERFYDWYLTRAKTENIESPCGAWVYKLNHTLYEEQRGTRASMRKDPVKVFEMNDIQPGVAERWLNRYISTVHTEARTKEEARQTYITDKPGQKALLWLTEQYDTVDIVKHPLLLRAIVHSLVAEQCDEIILQWLSLKQESAAVASNAKRGEPPHWKRELIQYLVEAAAFWSEEGLNAALKIFFDLKSHGHLSGLHGRAGVFIHRRLVRLTETGNIDATLYDNLGLWLAGYLKQPDLREFRLAEHKRAHPRNPDAMAAYNFVKTHAQMRNRSMWVEDLFNPKNGRGESHLYWFILRTARTLNLQHGHTKEAREILDIGASMLPVFFGVHR